MKKIFFLLLIIITFILGIDFVPSLTIYVTNNQNQVIGTIPLPIFECLVGLIFVFIIKKTYKNFNFGFKKMNSKMNVWIILPVVLTVLFNIISSTSMNAILHQTPGIEILVALASSMFGAFFVGFFEETVMRGALFNLFMSLFKTKEHCLWMSAVFSSVIFGVIHVGNLFGGADIGYTLYQVLYATAMGLVFSMVYVKTQSLFVPIAMHAIIDFSDFFFNFTGEPSMTGLQWIPITLTIVYVICAFLLYKSLSGKAYSLGFQD